MTECQEVSDMKYVLIGIAALIILIVATTQILLLMESVRDSRPERERLRRQKKCPHVWNETGCRCTLCGYEKHDWESYYEYIEDVCPHCGGNEMLDCEFCGVGGMVNTLQYRVRCRKCSADRAVKENS
jgi:hypothetical protein